MVGGQGVDTERQLAAARSRRSRRLLLRTVATAVLSVGAYLLLRRLLGSDALALAVSSAVPIGWMLAVGLAQRRVDPVALVAALVLGVALAVSLASGGGTLPLKLRRAVITGSLGIACVGSVLVRRPLLASVLDMLSDVWPQVERATRGLRSPDAARDTLVATAIIGMTLLGDAAAQIALALSVSTTTFVGVTGLTRLAVFAVGLVVCASYLRGAARRRNRAQQEELAG